MVAHEPAITSTRRDGTTRPDPSLPADRKTWRRLERRQRKEERATLETLGFWRGRTEHQKGLYLFLGLITAMLLSIGLVVLIDKRVGRVPDGLLEVVVTAFLAFGAFLLGAHEWRAARNETSLDKFYDRLEASNCLLDKWEAARPLAGPWPNDGRRDEHDKDEAYEEQMYVYRELDNLDYALAKYRIGFMSDENAHRSLRTFQARCLASREFCDLAIRSTVGNPGYPDETRLVVERCCPEAAARAKESPSA